MQLEDREVPLTRSMVNQLEHLNGMWSRNDITVVGSVSLPNEIVYLFTTPRGLQRAGHLPGVFIDTDAPRIILTK